MPSLFLMVIGDDLDPTEVSKALNMRASQCWRKGESKSFLRKDGTRLEFRSTHQGGGWKFHFRGPKSEKLLIRRMARVAKTLTTRKTQLLELRESGCDIFLVSLVQDASSIVIPPHLQQSLGELGIHLQIDFWPVAIS